MFRFTIRDVMWLMVMVGIEGAWFVDRRNLVNQHAKEMADDSRACGVIQDRHLAEIKKLQEANQLLEYRVRSIDRSREKEERIRKIQAGEMLPPP